ncbi:Uncharacterized membrane protein [Roseovarius tolerans]|uniref:Uncharacterized membrane protein n=1 Tax=Roseovarius tolerans TaxID=74031 RepID=A0A1H7WIA1_9RHOB|nr:DUF1269 domain-containing protein [Roseovarius tolerans]SEM21223.1 Uncharacterized membrane protein [Roseovarius tolerans]
MSDLLIIAFETSDGAFELDAHLRGLRRLQKLETQDIKVATRDETGAVELNGPANVPAMQVVGGTIWGLVLGAAFLVPVAGAVAGAATGAVVGQFRDPGVDSAFLKEIAEKLPKGGSALCLLVRDMDKDALLEEIAAFPQKGHLIQSPLEGAHEDRLRGLIETGKTE